MKAKKILVVVGARPQFVKAAVVSRALKAFGSAAEEKILHTGQHFDFNMSDVFFEELELPRPHFSLGISGGTNGQNTGRMIEKTEEVLLTEKPDMVVVYGDTDSALAGALAASKLHIPIAHVEAGLRSFNRRMAEEINRIVADHVSDILFTPTATGTKHALAEGIDQSKIRQVGDVMYDAALYYAAKSDIKLGILNLLNLAPKQYVLATLHRAENVDNRERLSNILQGLSASDLPVILPLHPRTRKMFQQFEISIPPEIRITDPVSYLEMIVLEKNAALIATDSGGVQKEAFFFKTPCITLRDETEWTELVEAGVNTLTGAGSAAIQQALHAARQVKSSLFDDLNLYGDGNAGEKIAAAIME